MSNSAAARLEVNPIDLVPEQLDEFARQGFLVLRQVAKPALVAEMRAVVDEQLLQLKEPLELEHEVGYPGAPSDINQPGGKTVRRLLDAYGRHPLFQAWATCEAIKQPLRQLLREYGIMLSRAHHNCIMTKHPAFSSITHWHQDVRYWSFVKSELISVWLALGDETSENGALSFLPGTHVTESIEAHRLDEFKFLRPELPENQTLINSSQSPRLAAGDVVFFHARTFHAAGSNRTNRPKYSVVFTYHGATNHPVAGTKSARLEEVEVT